MSSILTNTGSMVALQTLKSVNKGLDKVQNEVSTGLKVATAKENSSSWSIASTMNSDVSSYKKLGESLTSASALVGTARTAAEQIGDIVKQIQTKVVQAQNPDADLGKLKSDIDALADTIVSIGASAQYNGINLVNAAPAGAADVAITVAVTRDTAGAVSGGTALTVASANLGAIGTSIKGLLGDRTATGIGNTAALNTIDGHLDTLNAAAAAFGAAQTRIEAQNDFLSKQADSLKAGVSAMVDADMEEASARLTALQTQQQLGIQALSIANQAPQNVLSLFK